MTRDEIADLLNQLNAAENGRPNATVEETSARIDALMDPDVEGWRNGVHVPNRAAEKEMEMKAFAAMTDYHRTFERVIIEPPLACIGWTIRGTFQGQAVVAPGCSNFEVGSNGRFKRYWMYFNPADFLYRAPQ